MNIICYNPPGLCQDPASPVANYSSEAPDIDNFIGWNFGNWPRPGDNNGFINPILAQVISKFPPLIDGGGMSMNPPLGSRWQASFCDAVCVSDVSFEEAQLCAQRDSVDCLSDLWPTLDLSDPNDPKPVPRTVFSSTSQSCTWTCPDGLPFVFTVPAGAYHAFTQEAADQAASSFACNQVRNQHVCLGSLSPDVSCLNDPYHADIVATGPGPFFFEIVGGALPPGMTMAKTGDKKATISGAATSVGVFSFDFRAFNSAGMSMTKTFHLRVEGISNANLPDGTVGVSYSTQLLPVGSPTGTITWDILDGVLPDGLTLDPNTGVISGTPTVDGDFPFNVLMTIT